MEMTTQFWKLLDPETREIVGVVEVGFANDADLFMLRASPFYDHGGISITIETWDDVKVLLGFGEGDRVAYFPGIPNPEPFEGLDKRYGLERIFE